MAETKRETCKWAKPAPQYADCWSQCVYPLPPDVRVPDRFVWKQTCEGCACHEPKEDRDA